MSRTPVTVVGGYLGAGKTTLVNHLLRNACGLRIAVLVNDFGMLPIDADLIESQSDNLISIAGGCICCSFGSDLMGALMAIAQRDPAPDQVFIETSGVAMPGTVARSASLAPSLCVDSVVVLADAETVRARAADRFMGDTITRQLGEADLVVLNKTDLVATTELHALRAWMAREAPRARLVEAFRAAVPIEVMFGHGHTPVLPGAFSFGVIRPVEDAASRYVSESFTPDQPMDVGRLACELARLECGLVRAKGVLRDTDGTLRTLHVVGARFEVTPFTGAPPTATGLACIGLRGQIDRLRIENAIRGILP